MPKYRIKLRDFEDVVEVPREVRGILNVAEYITRTLAQKYARGMVKTQLSLIKTEEQRKTVMEKMKGYEQNWFDSHIDVITDLLKDLCERL